ncbi:MAG: MFS transporter [Gaiellaceae bacterium]
MKLRQSLAAFREVFRNVGLRRLQLAFAGSIIGTWAYSIAIVVYAYDQGGATAVGIVTAARFTLAAAASPFASILGDRYDRRWVMVASDATRALFLALTGVAAVANAPSWIVYVLSGLVAIAVTPFRPAEAALTPSLAKTPEQLTAANVVASTIESVGIFAGPALGGILLAAAGVGTVFLVSTGLLLWSAALIVGIHPPEREPAPEADSITDELLAGVRVIAKERRLRLLVGLFSAQTFVDGMLGVLVVVVALDLLGTGKAGVGFLNSAVGIGGLLGAVATAALMGRKRLAADFGLGIFMWGVPIALVAVWPNQAFALVLLGLVGVGNTIVDVSGMTLLQRSAPEEVLARVFGVLESMFMITIALGSLAAPLLLSTLGTRGALVAAGALLPVLLIPSWSTLAKLDDGGSVPAEQLELLRAVPIFAPLPEATIERLAAELQEVQAAAGSTIFEQGAAGDLFYVVRSGEVEVQADGKPPIVLDRGGFFGEIALLRGTPRTASVRARSEAGLYSLSRDIFIPAVTGYAPSHDAANRVVNLRLAPPRAGLVRV